MSEKVEKIETLLHSLGAETKFITSKLEYPYTKNVSISQEPYSPTLGKIGDAVVGEFGSFVVPKKGKKTSAQEFSYKKMVGYLNRLIKYGMRIVRKCEKLGIEIPSPVGQYLFLFTPAETEHLIMEGVTAPFATKCKDIYNTSDVEKIIAWKDLPEEWILILKDYT